MLSGEKKENEFALAVPLLMAGLFGIPIIINPIVDMSFDTVYLLPRLYWIYGAALPALLLVIYENKIKDVKKESLIYISIGFFLYLCLSVICNRAGWLGWWGQENRADGVLMHGVYVLALLAGWLWAKNKKDLLGDSVLLKAVFLVGGLLALAGVLQQIHILGVSNANALTGVAATPFGGTLGNRGYMGGAMALLLPVAIWGIGKIRSQRYWFEVAVVLMTWAWAGSLTRGAWLAGALGLGYLALSRGWSWRALRAVILGLVCWLGSAVLFGNFAELNAKLSQGAESSGRGVLWKSAIYGIQQRPLVGWGTPALIKAMNARPAEELLKESGFNDVKILKRLNKSSDQTFPAFLIEHPDGKKERVSLGLVNKVHNEYLDYAVTYGLPAALMFIMILGSAIWSGRFFAAGLSAGLIAYAAYLLTWPEIIRFAPIAWFMMGVALASQSQRLATEHP